MVCLDTSCLIDILKGKSSVLPIMQKIDKTEMIIGIPAPALMELWTGACRSRMSDKEKEKITELMQSLTFFPLDEKSAKEAGEIEAELFAQGTIINHTDIMIAGIARVNNHTLITRDGDYSHIPGLTILKY